jgi:hypothetical protein
VRAQAIGAGTQTSALCSTGAEPSLSNKVEKWDGTSWTEVTETNTSRQSGAGFGSSNTQAIVCAGETPSLTTNTEFWNGSSWTEVNNLSEARQGAGSIGNSGVAGMIAGGDPAGAATTTAAEEWTADNALSTVTVS